MKMMLKLMVVVAVAATQTAMPMMLSTDEQAALDLQLFEPVCAGDITKTQELLAAGANPNCQNEHGASPLHHAACYGQVEVARILLANEANLANKANLNIQSFDKQTPLFFAVIRDKFAMVRFLVEQGASLDIQDVDGCTALHMAEQLHRLDIAKYLCEKRANQTIKNLKGQSPRDIAEQREQVERAIKEGHEDLNNMLESLKKERSKISNTGFFGRWLSPI